MSRLALLTVLAFAGHSTAASVLISEVLIDPEGRDAGRAFAELTGPPGLLLDDFLLRGRNGRGGTVTHELALDGLRIPADGVLLLADGASGVTEVLGADAIVKGLDFQNGPDSIELLRGSTVLDALAYGSFVGDLLAFGEGRPVAIPPSGWSLERRWADLDTGDNLADFVARERPTPGTVSRIPEPTTVVLLVAGLGLGFVLAARRRRATIPAP